MTDSPLIVAALCWYDEPPEALTRCVDSLRGFVDTLVALDGPYAHYPHAETRSPSEQHSALEAAAEHALITLAAIPPHRPVPMTQAAKRTALYRAAARIAGPSGWILIIDADETLSGDVDAARSELAHGTGFDCAYITVRTGDAVVEHPRILRALPGLTCGPEYHGMLSANDQHNGQRVCIRDRRELITNEKPRPRRARELNLSRLLTLTNDTDKRPDDRKTAKLEYVRRRTAAGVDL